MLGLVGGGVVIAAIALWENIDIRQLTPGLAEAAPPVPQPLAPAEPSRANVRFRAVIFDSPANHDFFDDTTFHSSELGRWRQVIEDVGGDLRTASSAEELRATTPDDLMVLVESPCLSSAELAAVGAHLNNGGSVVTNWALGVRDGSCEWRGWATLAEVTGAEDIREIPPREALFLTVPGGLPLSPGVDPGTRIELRPDPSLALRIPGEKVYWSDWALNPAPDEEGAGADVAVATVQTEEGGRVTWFGVRAGQSATATDSEKLTRLLKNGVLWAAGTPLAAPSVWPDAAQAALVFVLEVEGTETYLNALDAAAMFEIEGLPATFFAVSQIVETNDSLAQALIAAGEVGTQTVDHTPLAGLTAQDQNIRLRRSWNDIEQWTGIGPAGLRPPEEAFDSLTLEAWSLAGGSYVLAGNEARSASPEVHLTDAGPVVLLPRLLKDDYTVIVRDVTVRSQRLAEAFLAGTRKMRAIGGLAVVAGHTQIIVSGPRLDAIRTVADTVRAQGDWWIARADEVADWWLARANVSVRWTESGPVPGGRGMSASGLDDLLVSTTSGSDLTGLWIDVVVPELSDGMIPLVDGASVDFAETDWGIQIRVGQVRSGEVHRISLVTLDETDGEVAAGDPALASEREQGRAAGS
jgi:peptidoglycan/xylan/chitin deacetylase (PgdA/CDA1 family)